MSNLSRHFTARQDKFIAWSWLAPLSIEYASDLVKNSVEFLQLLENFDTSLITEETLSFSIDIVSLYDSLRIPLVFEALTDAISLLRPQYTSEFKNWLFELTDLSLRGAYLSFEGDLYRPVRGIPAGSHLSVDLANISVFYILKKLLSEHKRSNLLYFNRFVDETVGIFSGNRGEFLTWFNELRNESLSQFNIDITFNAENATEFCQFLDVQFKFENGVLVTDLFRKPTDSNRYLHYTSNHPKHMYKGIIKSQGIRYRRIINNDSILNLRISELKEFFC